LELLANVGVLVAAEVVVAGVDAVVFALVVVGVLAVVEELDAFFDPPPDELLDGLLEPPQPATTNAAANAAARVLTLMIAPFPVCAL
jgi:hypothetical protein